MPKIKKPVIRLKDKFQSEFFQSNDKFILNFKIGITSSFYIEIGVKKIDFNIEPGVEFLNNINQRYINLHESYNNEDCKKNILFKACRLRNSINYFLLQNKIEYKPRLVKLNHNNGSASVIMHSKQIKYNNIRDRIVDRKHSGEFKRLLEISDCGSAIQFIVTTNDCREIWFLYSVSESISVFITRYTNYLKECGVKWTDSIIKSAEVN